MVYLGTGGTLPPTVDIVDEEDIRRQKENACLSQILPVYRYDQFLPDFNIYVFNISECNVDITDIFSYMNFQTIEDGRVPTKLVKNT